MIIKRKSFENTFQFLFFRRLTQTLYERGGGALFTRSIPFILLQREREKERVASIHLYPPCVPQKRTEIHAMRDCNLECNDCASARASTSRPRRERERKKLKFFRVSLREESDHDGRMPARTPCVRPSCRSSDFQSPNHFFSRFLFPFVLSAHVAVTTAIERGQSASHASLN